MATVIEGVITKAELGKYHQRHMAEGHATDGYVLSLVADGNDVLLTATDAMGKKYTSRLVGAGA